MKKIHISAPGKIILTGEHSVVYGYPALLSAIDKRLDLSLNVDEKSLPLSLTVDTCANFLQELPNSSIESSIPMGSGLGSSAALAVACATVLQVLQQSEVDLSAINTRAYEFEVHQHGTPSGADNTISTFGGSLWYRRESPSMKIFTNLKERKTDLQFPFFSLFFSGTPAESTKEMVQMVAAEREIKKQTVDGHFRELETVARTFLRTVLSEESNDWVSLIKENSALLTKLGVVSDSAQAFIASVEKIGGAAKITGAGGKSAGSGVILLYHPDQEKLEAWAKKNAHELQSVQLNQEGVTVL